MHPGRDSRRTRACLYQLFIGPAAREDSSVTATIDEMGVIQSLIERFERQRLPRLLELKKMVDEGKVLSESDIAFMDQVIHDAHQSKPLMDRHPDWQKFCA
jgi:hypothetical protein